MDEEQIAATSEPLAEVIPEPAIKPPPVDEPAPTLPDTPVDIEMPEIVTIPEPVISSTPEKPQVSAAIPQTQSEPVLTLEPMITAPEKPQSPDSNPQSPVSSPQSLPRNSSSELTTGDASPLTANFDVTLLTDEQLKAAAALYTKRNQPEISRKGVAKRKETMELNLREIVDYLSHYNGSPLPRIAKNTSITLGTTSKYLRQLIAKDKVRADGWGKTRRFFLK